MIQTPEFQPTITEQEKHVGIGEKNEHKYSWKLVKRFIFDNLHYTRDEKTEE